MNRIKLDLDRTLGEVDRNIFGGFVEHLGRSIYGGIYDPGSPLANKAGLRSDVAGSLARLRLANVRYPGGNFASGYRWRDGVGPVSERPPRVDLAWASIEPNTFGTNEFVGFCRKLGTEPYLVVNAGDGDMREARDWVEYCNGTSDTALVRLRAAHGHPEPHRIRYWGIGNEVDGAWQVGAKTAREYARLYHEFAKVMRWTDPAIRLIASATSDWDGDIVERAWSLVEETGDLIDYMAIHWYVGDKAGDSTAYLATSELIEARLSAYEGLMRGLTLGPRPRRPIPLAVDEWNVWYRATGGPTEPSSHPLEETYDLQDALVVAMHLNAFIRHAPTVRMANLAQLVNVIAPIVTRPDGILLQTIFYPFELFSRTTGTVALDAWWDGETFSGGAYQGVRTLDVSASLNPDRRGLAVHIVNRSVDQPVDAVIELDGGTFAGSVHVSTITGPDLKVVNTFDQPDCVTTTERTLEVPSPDTFRCSLPARSVTGLVFSL
ncbi:MAG: alpha-L-arabinofuranosidase C-terminal domain-containing protein [Chloroflexota bacterium]